MLTKTKKPSKQRKRRYNAPHHLRRKFFSAPLSRSLREQHGVRTMPIRSGDTVYIRKGSFKGIEEKVVRLHSARGKYFLEIENVVREKTTGVRQFYPISPSNVIITKFGTLDETRRQILERRQQARRVKALEESAKSVTEEELEEEEEEE